MMDDSFLTPSGSQHMSVFSVNVMVVSVYADCPPVFPAPGG